MLPWSRQSASAISLALGLLLTLATSFAEGQPAATAGGSAEQATQALVALGALYHAADTGTRAKLLGTLVGAAAARRQLLATLVEQDPGTVLRVALPGGLAARLPAQARAYIEEEVQLEGVLEILHEDRIDGHRYLYFLTTASERLALHFAADPPTLGSGARVHVRGVRVNTALALASSTTSVTTLSLAVAPDTFGERRTLVILVNFSDNPTQPYAPDYARSVVFDTASRFDLENSFQQTWLAGDVAGWFTIPLSSTVCDPSTLGNQALSAASAAGFVMSAYTRYIYAFPANACSWWGLGSVGGNPASAWVNGNLLPQAVSHETGHNLGLYHANALECGTTTLGSSCSTLEYGDYFDAMGVGYPGRYPGHYNAFQKERIGWLNYGTSPPITTVVANGTYTVEAYELLGWQPKAVKILKSTDPTTGMRTWYYVEYRQPIGFDSFLASNTNVPNGVLIHTGSESTGNSSKLLDLTPDTASWLDPALLVGQSFTDPGAGVTITTAWATSTQAGVTVSFGALACVQANPTVALSPSQSQWVAAGTTVTYTVSVTNNDTAGCAPSTFSLQPSVPIGWAAALGNSSITLSPGAAASTTLQVTSPIATPDAFYTVGASATNAGASSFIGSASATYVVASCGRASPTVGLSPSQSQWVAAGTTVTYTVSVTNNDTAACAPSTFSLQPSVPIAWTGALGSSSITLGPGAAASTTLQVTSPTATADGFYTIGASATNIGARSYTGSASATYSILSSLVVNVSTDQSSYARKQIVSITALVTTGSSPVANATLTFTVTKANGSVVTGTATTGATGTAVFTMRLKPQDPVGVYQVRAAASASGGLSATATTSFTVQ